MGNVRYVDEEFEVAVIKFLNGYSVVKIPCIFPVNGKTDLVS